jgi:hypothetical protein
MNYLTRHLEPFLLKPVEFIINGKTVRKGKIKVFNFRQYFVKFSIETESGDTKTYDVLYPFKIEKDGQACVFNYHLSCFSRTDDEMFFKMKTIKKEKCLPTYDGVLILKPLSQ